MDKAQQRREATEAFRAYAARGQDPSHAEMLDASTWLSDMAVSQTLSVLTAQGKSYIADAVREVYFADPSAPLHRNDIEMRVTSFCMTRYVSRATVYNWLANARTVFWAISHHRE